MKIVAHRGASGELPEHTLAAYQLAHHQGADGYECDIRLTKDEHLVCIHDRHITRVCVDIRSVEETARLGSKNALVSELTLAELKGLNFGTPDVPAEVLTLAELLDFYQDEGGRDGQEMFIETKHPNRFGPKVEFSLFQEMEKRGLLDNRNMHLISFSPNSLVRFKKLNPATHRILLRREYQKVMNPTLEKMRVLHSHGLSLAKGKVRPDIIGRSGRGTYMWTVDKQQDVQWAKAKGVDWLATNYPGDAVQWRDAY